MMRIALYALGVVVLLYLGALAATVATAFLLFRGDRN